MIALSVDNDKVIQSAKKSLEVAHKLLGCKTGFVKVGKKNPKPQKPTNDKTARTTESFDSRHALIDDLLSSSEQEFNSKGFDDFDNLDDLDEFNYFHESNGLYAFDDKKFASLYSGVRGGKLRVFKKTDNKKCCYITYEDLAPEIRSHFELHKHGLYGITQSGLLVFRHSWRKTRSILGFFSDVRTGYIAMQIARQLIANYLVKNGDEKIPRDAVEKIIHSTHFMLMQNTLTEKLQNVQRFHKRGVHSLKISGRDLKKMHRLKFLESDISKSD